VYLRLLRAPHHQRIKNPQAYLIEELGRFELLDARKNPVNVAQHKGKVVVIEFWATWCAPCLKSMEQTHALQRAAGGQVVVIAVSGDPEENHKKAVDYVNRKGYDFIVAFDDQSRRSVQIPYIPSRLVLDRDGRLRVREFGYSQATEYLFEQKLKGLLAQ
jgi:thiol-disulfide isomerase/thioredoxin